MSGGISAPPATRDRDPDSDDWGQVTRPIFPPFPVLVVSQVQPSNAAHTIVARTIIPTQLLAANANRLGAVFHNNSNDILYIKLGVGVTTTSFTVRLTRQATYEVAWPTYTGVVEGVWGLAGAGDVQITELT